MSKLGNVNDKNNDVPYYDEVNKVWESKLIMVKHVIINYHDHFMYIDIVIQIFVLLLLI